jgi:hypothetical protein
LTLVFSSCLIVAVTVDILDSALNAAAPQTPSESKANPHHKQQQHGQRGNGHGHDINQADNDEVEFEEEEVFEDPVDPAAAAAAAVTRHPRKHPRRFDFNDLGLPRLPQREGIAFEDPIRIRQMFIVKELYESELAYVERLSAVVKYFVQPLCRSNAMSLLHDAMSASFSSVQLTRAPSTSTKEEIAQLDSTSPPQMNFTERIGYTLHQLFTFTPREALEDSILTEGEKREIFLNIEILLHLHVHVVLPELQRVYDNEGDGLFDFFSWVSCIFGEFLQQQQQQQQQ